MSSFIAICCGATSTPRHQHATWQLHAEKIDAIPDPPTLVDLWRRLEGMLPRIDLSELLLEVMGWLPAFVRAFTGVSDGPSRPSDLDVTIAGALTAHALNVGYIPVISEDIWHGSFLADLRFAPACRR